MYNVQNHTLAYNVLRQSIAYFICSNPATTNSYQYSNQNILSHSNISNSNPNSNSLIYIPSNARQLFSLFPFITHPSINHSLFQQRIATATFIFKTAMDIFLTQSNHIVPSPWTLEPANLVDAANQRASQPLFYLSPYTNIRPEQRWTHFIKHCLKHSQMSARLKTGPSRTKISTETPTPRIYIMPLKLKKTASRCEAKSRRWKHDDARFPERKQKTAVNLVLVTEMDRRRVVGSRKLKLYTCLGGKEGATERSFK